MPDPVTGVGAAVSIGGSLLKGKSASKAGQLQYDAAMAGVDETRQAREEMRALLQPYTAAGGPALEAQMAALGLAGPEAQQQYVMGQEESPLFQALARQQEEAILQNASATGGLRGGNVQGALAQFRPQLLNQFLEQQYGRLGGMTQLGQRSAAGVGAAGMDAAGDISTLLGQGGAAKAGSDLAQGQMYGNILGSVGGVAQGLLGGGINNSINKIFKSDSGIF
jgi:hypothetical protein